MLIGKLGNQEIIICACDDGDVVAYRTADVRHAIDGLASGLSQEQATEKYLRPLLLENIGKSAWGLTIHTNARKIAASCNTRHVTVWSFALTDASKILHDSLPEELVVDAMEELEPVVDTVQKTEPLRRPWEIVLHGHDQNIPNISFANVDDDKEGRYVASVDLRGVVFIWDLQPTRNSSRMISPIHRPGELPGRRLDFQSGWSVVCVDPKSAIRADSFEEFLGCENPIPEGCISEITVGRMAVRDSADNFHSRSEDNTLDLAMHANQEIGDDMIVDLLGGLASEDSEESEYDGLQEAVFGEEEETDGDEDGDEDEDGEDESEEDVPILASTENQVVPAYTPVNDQNSALDMFTASLIAEAPHQELDDPGRSASATFRNPMPAVRRERYLNPASVHPTARPNHPPSQSRVPDHTTVDHPLRNLYDPRLGGDRRPSDILLSRFARDSDESDFSLPPDHRSHQPNFSRRPLLPGHARPTPCACHQPTQPCTQHSSSHPSPDLDYPFAVFQTGKKNALLHLPPFDRPSVICCRNPCDPNRVDMHMEVYSYERLHLTQHIPELSVVITASGSGRAAVFTITRRQPLLTEKEKGTGQLGPRKRDEVGMRLDWVLPLASQEDRKERPMEVLVGIATAPLQGLDDDDDGAVGKARGEEKRRWRLVLTYADHTVLTYELWRREGENRAAL